MFANMAACRKTLAQHGVAGFLSHPRACGTGARSFPHQKARTLLRKVESLHNSVKPAIVSLSPWFGGYRLEVDNDGDCFGLSWIAAVLIWVAHSKGRISEFVTQLHDAGKKDGAFCRLGDISKVGSIGFYHPFSATCVLIDACRPKLRYTGVTIRVSFFAG